MNQTFSDIVELSIGKFIEQYGFIIQTKKDTHISYIHKGFGIYFTYNSWDKAEHIGIHLQGKRDNGHIDNRVIRNVFMSDVEVNFKCDLDKNNMNEFTDNVLRLLKEPKGQLLLSVNEEFYDEIVKFNLKTSREYTDTHLELQKLPQMEMLFRTKEYNFFLKVAEQKGIDNLSEEDRKRYYQIKNGEIK